MPIYKRGYNDNINSRRVTCLNDLFKIAEELDVNVDFFCFSKLEAMSFMDESGNCYIAIDPAKITSAADERTKLGHELGHCATGSFYRQSACFDVKGRFENRANKWAIRRLIPKDQLDAAVANGHTEIYDLAEYFGVTESFMRMATSWYQSGNIRAEKFILRAE